MQELSGVYADRNLKLSDKVLHKVTISKIMKVRGRFIDFFYGCPPCRVSRTAILLVKESALFMNLKAALLTVVLIDGVQEQLHRT